MCLFYVGGGVVYFYCWWKIVFDYVEIVLWCLFGCDFWYKEWMFLYFDEMVEDVLCVFELWLMYFYVIFGYSMGVFLGYELERCFNVWGKFV